VLAGAAVAEDTEGAADGDAVGDTTVGPGVVSAVEGTVLAGPEGPDGRGVGPAAQEATPVATRTSRASCTFWPLPGRPAGIHRSTAEVLGVAG